MSQPCIPPGGGTSLELLLGSLQTCHRKERCSPSRLPSPKSWPLPHWLGCSSVGSARGTAGPSLSPQPVLALQAFWWNVESQNH